MEGPPSWNIPNITIMIFLLYSILICTSCSWILSQIIVLNSSSMLQVNLCQKLLFFNQLTHNMTTDCSLNYKFSTWKLQAQNTLRTCSVHKLFWMSKQKNNLCKQHVMSLEFSCKYWTCNSMNNLSSYCGLVDARVSASDKDLPVH